MRSWDSLRPVLVLEDDAELRGALSRFLEHLGYRVIDAGDAESALRLCEEHSPCLIFADLMLPHVDGEAFVAELRRRQGEDAPPVVLLSASEIRTEVARRCGAAASLAKPFTLEDLSDIAWRFAHTERLRQTGEAFKTG